MKASTERKIIRWVHLIFSIPIIGYIYGPVASLPGAAMTTRIVFFPVIVLSGLWLWKGQVMWGMMVYDNLRALDYLETRNDVDMKRVATMGMSMGSTMAWWLGALDERIKVCVDMCCLTDFQTLIEEKGLGLHSIYYYVPDLLNHFSTAEINSLIAPRPHLAVAGTLDPLTPLRGMKKIDSILKEVYSGENAADAWELRLYEVGHAESPEMRRDILVFLKKWL